MLTYSPFKDKSQTITEWLVENPLDKNGEVFIQLSSLKGLNYNKIDLKESECVYLFPAGKRNRLYEWLSGQSAAEDKLAGVVCSTQLFKKLENYQPYLTNANRYNHWFRKNTSKIYNQAQGKPTTIKVNLLEAIKQNFSNSLAYITSSIKGNPMVTVFFALCLSLLFIMPAMSSKAGITGDEILQHEYGKIILNYYTGNDSVDTKALKSNRFDDKYIAKAKELGSDLATEPDRSRKMHLYGSSFDTLCAFLIDKLGVTAIYDFRHKVNALFGFLVILFGSLIIKRITGSYLYATIGLVILFFTPRLLGESYNNPKDIPFAAGYTMAVYYAMLAFSNIRNIRTSHLIGLILGSALAISIRIGGLLVVAIAVFYAALKYIEDIGWSQFLKLKWTGLGKPLITVGLVVVLSYILGIYFWPWGWSEATTNPLKALTEFSAYSGSIRQLFEGQLWDSDVLPRYYLVKYIWITLPLVSLVGVFIFAILSIVKRSLSLPVFLVLFAAVFPLVYIFIQNSNVYGGLRHILFVLPMIIAIAVLGWQMLEQLLSQKIGNKGKFVLFAPLLLTALPARFVVKNHPLEYIYFNETVGGTAGAYGQYEMDYYLAGLRESTQWLIDNKIAPYPNKAITVCTYDPNIVGYYLKDYPNVHVGFARYDDKAGPKWDYTIFYNAYMDASRLNNGLYPPKGTIYSPMVDGKPMGVVIAKENDFDSKGNVYLSATPPKLDSAILFFNKYLKYDPNSSEVLYKMAQAYAMSGNIPKMEEFGNKALKTYPEMHVCMYLMAQGYQNAKMMDKADAMLLKVLDSRPKESQAYYMLAISKANKQNIPGAIEDMKKAIEYTPYNDEFYNVMAQLQTAANNQGEATRYQNAVKDIYTRNDIYMEFTSGKPLEIMETLDK